jgi:pilus assembly protein CpaC
MTMPEKNTLRIRSIFLALLMPLLSIPSGMAEPVSGSQVLKMAEKSQRVLNRPQPILRVAVADPEVLDVEMVTSREMLMTAKRQGATEMRLWVRGAPMELLRILVGPAAPAVDFQTQVRSDIRIVEVSRRALKESGISLAKNTANTTVSITPPGGLSGVSGLGSGSLTLESASGFLPIAQAFNLVSGNADKGLLGVISLLEGNGFAYTLAEPSLTVMSGETASFLAGGEIPIPVSQGATGAVSIQFRDFGVRLTLTPTVLDPQRIVVKVAPEVSELDFSSAVSSAGVTVPGLRVRRTETTVQLADGESFVISGLLSVENSSNVDKVPLLGDIPILGAFFKSTRLERGDKELIMVVTPHLVRALERHGPGPDLPGEGYRQYNPGIAELMFFESGDFDRLEGGFSE